MPRRYVHNYGDPDTLWQIGLTYCAKNLDTFCQYDESTQLYNLRDGVSLPTEVCQSLLATVVDQGYILDDKFAHVFVDRYRTRLKRINIRNSDVTDEGLKWLVQHKPTELNFSGCQQLTKKTVTYVNEHGKNLCRLFVGNAVRIFQDIEIKEGSEPLDLSPRRQEGVDGGGDHKTFGGDYIFDCPGLQEFSVHNLNETQAYAAHDIIATLLHPFRKLGSLDLSGCQIELEFMDCLEDLQNLRKLVLYDVPIANIYGALQVIGKMKRLRYEVKLLCAMEHNIGTLT